MKGITDFEPDNYYHIVNHAVGNENLFREEDNYRYFLRRYAHYMPSVCSTYAYCLMPNHIHFLIGTRSEVELAQHPKFKGDFHKVIMQQLSNLLNAYTKAYNKKYERRGPLWINHTKRFLINSDKYLMSVINYIHQNPVNHGFVANAEDWDYSSFNTLFSEKPILLNRSEVIQKFGSVDEYLKYHKAESVKLVEDWEW